MEKGIVVSEKYWEFDYGRNHPVRTLRIKLTFELMREFGITYKIIEPEEATWEELLTFHTPEYLKALKEEKIEPSMGLGNSENPVIPGLFKLCSLTAGGTLKATRAAIKGGIFFNLGGGMHHAKRNRASGFCYINDIVIAIEEARNSGVKKILYLDFDAHHCDAVQETYYLCPEVLVISLHQEDVFPGTGKVTELGEEKGYGYNINIPLPRYTEDEDVLYIFEKLIVPVIKAYEPEMVFIQAGVDAHKDDPLTALYLTTGIYEKMAELIKPLLPPSVVVTGGGGYDMINVARIWTLFWGKLTGKELEDILPSWFLRIAIMEGYEGPGIRDIPGWSGTKETIKKQIKEEIDFLKRNLPFFKEDKYVGFN